MNATSSRRRLLPARLALAALIIPAFLVLGAPLAAGADQPIVSVGPLGTSANTVSVSGSQSSGGQTDLCLNGQQSQIDPTASTVSDAVQVDSTTCATTGPTSNTQTSSAASNGGAGPGSTESHVASNATATSVVEAVDASQLRIDTIRFTTNRIRTAKKLGVVVTLRGQQNSLVQNGIVSINGAPGAKLACSCQRVTFSNQLGQAAFTIPVRKAMLGRRLYLRLTAHTPTLRTARLVSIRLP